MTFISDDAVYDQVVEMVDAGEDIHIACAAHCLPLSVFQIIRKKRGDATRPKVRPQSFALPSVTETEEEPEQIEEGGLLSIKGKPAQLAAFIKQLSEEFSK